jgi:hypothetical protein
MCLEGRVVIESVLSSEVLYVFRGKRYPRGAGALEVHPMVKYILPGCFYDHGRMRNTLDKTGLLSGFTR